MEKTKSGIAVILNGPSVAGKTSIQKALQEALKEPYMAMGIDSILVAMAPQRYFLGQEDDRKEVLWGEPSEDEDGNPLFHLYFGEKGRNIVFGMNDAIAAFVKNGNNVIVDYIQYEKNWMPHLTNALKDYKAVYVKVNIPLTLLEEREANRATSPKGHARSHYDTVYKGVNYDITVDTSKNTAKDCANQIMNYMKKQKFTTI